MFPADTALGLFDNSTASPLVQEMCALLVSKMPCEQAEPVASRVAGIELSRSTMAREAQRQGERAIQMREKQSSAPSVAAADGSGSGRTGSTAQALHPGHSDRCLEHS